MSLRAATREGFTPPPPDTTLQMPRGSVLWIVALTAVTVPAAAAGDVLASFAWSAPFATPAWSKAHFEESRVWAVHVEGPGAVHVRANGTTGVQLHVFPDVPGALIRHPGGHDAVPGATKVRSLGPGDWLVAVDPSAPRDEVAVAFEGTAGRDRAVPLGPWTCPFDPRSGCLP